MRAANVTPGKIAFWLSLWRPIPVSDLDSRWEELNQEPFSLQVSQ